MNPKKGKLTRQEIATIENTQAVVIDVLKQEQLQSLLRQQRLKQALEKLGKLRQGEDDDPDPPAGQRPEGWE